MKIKITLSSLVVGAILFSGCAMTGASISKAEMKQSNMKDLLVKKHKTNHILAYNNKKVLFTSYRAGVIGNNLSNVDFDDVFRTRDFLKDYCEAKGGKWEDGKRYQKLALTDMIRGLTAIAGNYPNDDLGKCNLPNGNGFTAKEFGVFDYKRDWTIPNNMGGGERVSWHNYYEIEFNKPQPVNKNYLALSNPTLKAKYPNADKVIKTYNEMDNYGQNNYFLTQLNTICKNFGGTAYIVSDKMNNKKMTLNNYMIAMFDKLYNKHKNEDETIDKSYRLFPINKEAVISCENTTNPNNQFMLIWQPDEGKFKAIKGYDKSSLQKINTNPNIVNKVRAVTNIVTKKISPDKNAGNIAKSMFMVQSDIKIDNNPYVKYYGYYIGKIDNCKYASVDKKEANMDYIYNFKQCNDNIEYTGRTIKGLSSSEYKRFNPYISGLKNSCKVNGKALVNVNGYNLYCKSNTSGNSLEIFILDNQFRLRDVK